MHLLWDMFISLEEDVKGVDRGDYRNLLISLLSIRHMFCLVCCLKVKGCDGAEPPLKDKLLSAGN